MSVPQSEPHFQGGGGSPSTPRLERAPFSGVPDAVPVSGRGVSSDALGRNDIGVSLEEGGEPFELRRADTNSIVGDFQGAGTGVVVAGLALAGVYSSIASVLVWYSTQVPLTCRPGLGTTFRLMGSLDGVLGVLMVCFFLAAKGLVDAMSHGVLAEKYESEGRTEEAERQKEEAAKKMAGAFLQGCFPTLGFLLLQACLLATWVYGIVQAVHADGHKCGSAVTVFWVMLGVNVASAVFSTCLEARAGVPRPSLHGSDFVGGGGLPSFASGIADAAELGAVPTSLQGRGRSVGGFDQAVSLIVAERGRGSSIGGPQTSHV